MVTLLVSFLHDEMSHAKQINNKNDWLKNRHSLGIKVNLDTRINLLKIWKIKNNSVSLLNYKYTHPPIRHNIS